ncbi:hypothetical protein HWB81_gp11 [Bacillus phage Wes44]|uniref:Uncharacterized protein n=1 Tax=Bacillus phage Wes44 TaxID=2283012 RepID=A0A346FK15_9CAUD|nr:hypothetical protein HWB81_gp11 [Bacillus phage Wes44]AXN58320.1 hypothetical protein Wes44_11 [Bacillus phage Wes44]
MAKLKGKITKDMKEKAAANGIGINLLRYRIAKGWDELKAITEPPRKQAPTTRSNPDMLALAKENGISANNYKYRVRELKWDEFDAATRPLTTAEEKAAMSSEARGGLPRHLVDIAASNGISYITLYRRLRVYEPAWEVERAITEPPLIDRLPVRGLINATAEELGIDWKAIRAKELTGHYKHDPVILAIAKANGINYNTYIYRTVTRKPRMTPLDAATAPINEYARRVKV